MSTDQRAYFFGFLGILAFSLTVPLTRYAVPELGTTVVGLGRGFLASLLAILVLSIRRDPLPARRYWPVLPRVAFGVTFVFPILSAVALQKLPATHAAVITGLQPATTAIFAALRAGERPPPRFWLAAMAGIVAVLAFASTQGAGRPRVGDLLLLIALAVSSFGHVEAALIAREIGGWRVISWSLVFSCPLLALPLGVSVARHGLHGDARPWLALAFLATFSAYLGFFPWYRGMTLAGIARIGQLQLAQPVLSLLWAVLLLGERLDRWTVLASATVIGSVALTRRAWRPGGGPPPPTPSPTSGRGGDDRALSSPTIGRGG